jgi:hypothetical protein
MNCLYEIQALSESKCLAESLLRRPHEQLHKQNAIPSSSFAQPDFTEESKKIIFHIPKNETKRKRQFVAAENTPVLPTAGQNFPRYFE